MKKILQEHRNALSIALLLIFSFLIALPLFHPGMFATDDGNWMIIRFAAFYHALRVGQFPVRFLPQLNFGYGYPVPTFLYPGFMYLGVPVKALGFSFVSTIKIVFALSVIGFIFSTYFWLRHRFSIREAYVGAVFAPLVSYLTYDIYTRGSMGEVLAISLVPFIFWMIERKSIFWTGVGVGLLIISHNTLALLFLPVIFLYGILAKTMRKRSFLTAFVLGGASASFFAIPAILELSNTVFAKTSISNPLHYFADIRIIGWLVIGVLIIAFFRFVLSRKKPREKPLLLFFFVVSCVSIFMALPISSPFWQILPSGFIQFPFRFLSFLPVSIAFLAAYSVGVFQTREQKIVLFVIVFIVLSFSVVMSFPMHYEYQPDSFYATNEATTTVKDEYMPVWVKVKPTNHPGVPVEFVKGSGTLENLQALGSKISFQEIGSSKSVIQVNTVYWPGWQAQVDGKPILISYHNAYGVMRLNVPSGSHMVSLRFVETPYRLFADILSSLGFVVLLVLGLSKRVRKLCIL